MPYKDFRSIIELITKRKTFYLVIILLKDAVKYYVEENESVEKKKR